MQLNYAVVHELVKETGTLEAEVDLAETLLSAESRVVVDLVSQIVGLIGQRENMAHYGVFRDDAASTRIPSIVTSYCMEAEPTPGDFLSLTNDCMTALRDRAGSQNLATGGYLLFADYVSTGRFLLVAMIKQRSGITMDGLVPTSITELDLRQLHQVARVAFERLCRYEETAAEERQDMTYVTFVSPKGSQRAAGYFVTALGCEQGTPAAAATKAVIAGTNDFFDNRDPIRSRRYEVKEELLGLFKRKVDANEHAKLLEIYEVVRKYFPLEEADSLSEEFAVHLQSETSRVPMEFPVSKATVNRYTRFKYRGTQLTMEIDKAAVTREDGGPFYFNEEHRKLVISEEDFITKLSVALQDDE